MKLSLLRGRALAPCFALAVFSALSLASYFELFQAKGFLFLACFLLFGAASGLRATRRERVVFALLSLLFSFMRVAGRSYDLYDSHVLLMKNAASMLHAAAAMAALFFCAFSGFLLLHRLVCGLLIPAPEQEKRMPEGRFFASLVFILILGSVPYLLLYPPGLNIADTRDQLLQFFGYPSYIGDGSALSDHHPVLTTLLYGGFMKLGLLLGSANRGQLLYSAASILAFSFSLSYLLLTLARLGMRRQLARGIAAFYALWPVPALYAFNMGKDSTVIPFVLLFACQLLILFRKEERPGAGFYVGLAANAFLLMVLRKSASYCLLASLVFLLSCLPGRRKGTAAAFLSAIVLFAGYNALLPRLGVIPGETREILSLPVQQAARALRDEEVSPEDAENLGRFLDRETAATLYDPRLSDPVKDRTNPEATGEDLLSFAKGWISVGVRHPSCFLSAWMNMIYGYFYPSDSNTILCLTLNSPEAGELSLSQNSGFKGLRLAFHNFVYFRLRRVPGLSPLFYVSGVVFTFLFLFSALWASRGFSAAAPFAFFLCTLGIAMFSPKSGEIRYILPLVYALPAMLGALSLSGREGKP